MFSTAYFLYPRQIRHFNAIHHFRQTPDDRRNVDPALAKIEPLSAPCMNQFVLGFGDGWRSVTKMCETQQVRRNPIKIVQSAAGTVEVQHIERDAGIVAAGLGDQLRSIIDRSDASPSDEFDYHADAAALSDIAQLAHLINDEGAILGPDIGQHMVRAKFCGGLDFWSIDANVRTVQDAGVLGIVKPYAGIGQRPFGLCQ